ncbi:PREDICTED: uncharacterized protein LOC108762979 [Trachymyrmex cornetzi]|uniref:uncharacterized protein LOC108762979 n=1 Tax=Trachymyrmex cornetzi TaxID=471704 RepID=UPI00084F0330|nr:PREDICTED: uncharacterized protein LOC108762979 [Trachymyrmex cornetzi]
MGSPLSPTIANLVLQDLENKCLNNLRTKPSLYMRYMDDIALATNEENMMEIMEEFNKYHERLQFTLEVGKEKLNFLDVSLIKNKNEIIHDWYQKPTSSGQTSRTLKTRIAEHRNHINWNSTQRSVITEHRLEFSHEFDWNGIEILDEERILNKRLTSEMIHIKRQKNSLNLQTDTERLNSAYECLLK